MKGLPIRQPIRLTTPSAVSAFDVIHGLDEVVDAERNCGDENDAEEFEAGEDVTNGWQRHRETEIGKGIA